MTKNRKTPTEATHAHVHRRAFQRFSRMPQDEREEVLVRFGILTKEKRLSPRYGGSRRGASAREVISD